ncbi:hypothetical protein G6Z34_13395 [Clostridium perfringens]|uniref:Uncharacterized protein n=1 Tax=Clostridium perfringens TaxID=1502 RepID=A0AAP6WPV4_CLOPF|nr:hypothetical protein [Clostridium perfringens]NGU31080.1 hypothetical protein [Clostridium perfringens]
MIECTLINNETGEILDRTYTVKTAKEEEKIKDIINFTREKSDFENNILHNLGHFYFNFYKKLPNKLDKQYIFRFIYLCTYLKYGDNRLMRRVKQNKYELIKVSDLMDLLKLGKTEYNKTKKVLEEGNLIKVNKDYTVAIDNKISFIGKVNKNNKQEYSRIFKESIQELYNNSTPREHKRLALFIELLPFIHYKYNIICKNPRCELMQDVEPFTIQELQKISGNGGKNITRFKNNLLNIMVGGQKAMMLVEDYEKKFFIVNPKIYYKGNDLEDLTYLINLFRI